ncbi:hypothetical protein CBS147332_1925 [Penicillium roqueforti]|nr:hypothetical protein CBS147332_1925 [Penicillium roqueforti]KAI3107243.1 hypothetical protein CBS147331_6549 [Penicillium roqueforti]
MMVSPLHREFGHFSFVLEETSVSGRYRVKMFPRFQNLYQSPMPDFTTVASHNPRYPAHNESLLAVHATVGNILHATGRGELITKTIQHLGDNSGHALAKDGSTNVEELLSVTGLSLLATSPSHRPPARKENYSRYVRSRLPRAENQPPSVTDD